MSGSIPNSGYILEIKKAIEVPVIKEMLDHCVNENKCEKEDYHCLWECTDGYLEKYPEITLMNYDSDNGGHYDNLSDGLYVLFGEDYLYDKTLTDFGKLLENANHMPKFNQWETFG